MKVWDDDKDERELSEMLYDRYASDNSEIWALVLLALFIALIIFVGLSLFSEAYLMDTGDE